MIFTINAGSSSLKFSLYPLEGATPSAYGMVERIGNNPKFHLTLAGQDKTAIDVPNDAAHDNPSTLNTIFKALTEKFPDLSLHGIGHRIVHGGIARDKPDIITRELLDEIAQLSPFAPLHQPHNIAGVQAAMQAFPEAVQVACFDTAFHRHHPFVCDTFALPRRYYEKGVRRYGFHGLSYDYITRKLKADYPDLHAGRVIVAHLGSGASMCAIKAGQSVASTMGFSALDGLPMGTRCGQIDPEVILYLIEQEKMTPDAVSNMLYKESGLLGMSGVSNDIRELDASDHPHAKEALAYMVSRIRREVGGMAAIMGGVDALVFCGGIGENHAWTRAQVCHDFAWAGITIDDAANEKNATRINADGPVSVLVLPTNEEEIIARATRAALANP